MNEFFKKVEHFVDKSIPYLLILLLVIVFVDIFYTDIAHKYEATILTIDIIIVCFFVVDLIFKYLRVQNIPKFLRTYWLDILAIFPFFLLLRVFEEVLLVSEASAATVRNLFHAGLVLEEDVLVTEKVVKTSELIAKEGRVAVFLRSFAKLQRMPRLLKALSYFEHPKHRKTLYHKKN
jgi:hypothetical protein